MLAGQRSIRYLVPDLGKAPTRSESSRGRRNALASNFSPLSLSMHAFIFFFIFYLLSEFDILCDFFFLSSLLITSLGHIKLTDFGLSKVGLMNSKYSFFPFVFIVLFRVSRALFGTLLIQSPLYPISVCIFSILFSIHL